METVKTEEGQLEKVLAVCQALDAEFREIQSKAGQFSGVVCYCFDAFSTLVYEV